VTRLAAGTAVEQPAAESAAHERKLRGGHPALLYDQEVPAGGRRRSPRSPAGLHHPLHHLAHVRRPVDHSHPATARTTCSAISSTKFIKMMTSYPTPSRSLTHLIGSPSLTLTDTSGSAGLASNASLTRINPRIFEEFSLVH
jgi:hypothetical protein